MMSKKNMNILLINCPAHIKPIPSVYPFGIFYIYKTLIDNGYSCDFLDIEGYEYSKEKVIEYLKNKKYDIYGIGGLTTVYPYLHWLVPEIKRINHDSTIVIGGLIAGALGERCMSKLDIDYAVIGEGEITIVELLKAIHMGRGYDQVKGIAYKEKGKVIFTERRALMETLDDLPRLDDSIFPTDRYLKNTNRFYIHAQRGCPSNCTFCYNNFRVEGKIRYRPYQSVVDDIEYFIKKYGDRIAEFNLAGDCIAWDKEWILNFCKEIIKRNLCIKYRINSRIDTIDEERLQWLQRSGCEIMLLGLESGSKKILRIMKKGIDLEQGLKMVAMATQYISHVEPAIMLGYLGEDETTLRETIEYAKKLPVMPRVTLTQVFPGTELFRLALEQGKIKNEEGYLMSLDRVNFWKFFINLTDFSDNEVKDVLDNARIEIEEHFKNSLQAVFPTVRFDMRR